MTTTYLRRRVDLMRAAVEKLGVNFGVNDPPEQGLKSPPTTHHGNQHRSRERWLGDESDRENSGGGGQIRTVDAADMSHEDSDEDC